MPKRLGILQKVLDLPTVCHLLLYPFVHLHSPARDD